MSEPGDEVLASVPPYVSRWLLAQMCRGPVTKAAMRAHAAYLRGIGQRVLADQLEFGWRQLEMSARSWEDRCDRAVGGGPARGRASAAGSGAAEAPASVGVSATGSEITAREAAMRLGMTREAVGQRLRSGALRGRKVGSAWLVDGESVELAARERRAS